MDDRVRERLEAARHLSSAGFASDAVGRASYAMFTAARALLVSRDLRPRTYQGVWRSSEPSSWSRA